MAHMKAKDPHPQLPFKAPRIPPNRIRPLIEIIGPLIEIIKPSIEIIRPLIEIIGPLIQVHWGVLGPPLVLSLELGALGFVSSTFHLRGCENQPQCPGAPNSPK